MEKILALLSKLSGSLTVWVTGALAVISFIEPVLQMLEGVIGTLSPSKAMLITAALAFLSRLRTLLGSNTAGSNKQTV
jgi:hypothetical protein